MLKQLAIWIASITIILGLVFLSLDILDIAEGYKYNFPMSLLNTIFISGTAVLIVFLAAKSMIAFPSPGMLGITCAAFAFGFSILIYAWLNGAGLATRLTAYDAGILLFSVSHAAGAGWETFHTDNDHPRTAFKPLTLVYCSLLIIIIVSAASWLAYHGVFNTGMVLIGGIEIRYIIRGIALLLSITASVIYLLKYLKLHRDFYYWCFLGLVLFTFGTVLISISQLEGRVAWLGRWSQYISGLYFLAAIIFSNQKNK